MRDPRSTWAGDDPTAEGGAQPPDRYELRAEIGRGGMGRVYAAWDPVLGREVALKVMAPARETADFLREARLAARLEHPAIVPVHDAGVSEAGEPWYAMRLVRGRTLRDAIAEPRDPPERRLELLDAVIEVARALAHAHERGVVHRDLKPDNVLVGPWGEVQLVDWGLAQAVAESDPFLGRSVGTPAWMSPEQRRGERADPRADVWALGLLLRAVVLGGAPWEEPGAATPPLPAWCPAELAAIAARAASEAPADRYPHAGALAEDLLAFRSGRRVSAHAYSLGDELRRLNARFWWPLRFTAGALAAGVVSFGLVVGQVRTARRAEAEAADALTRSLLQAAQEADRARRGVEALSFAAEALTRREDPVARGIVARWLANLPVEVAAVGDRVPAPCTQGLARGELLVCSGPEGTWAARGLALAWWVPGGAEGVRALDAEWVASGDPTRLVVRRAADGAEVARREPGLRNATFWADRLRLGRGRVVEDLRLPDLAVLAAWEAPSAPASFDPAPSQAFWAADGARYVLEEPPSARLVGETAPRTSLATVDRGAPGSGALAARLDGGVRDFDPESGVTHAYDHLPIEVRRVGVLGPDVGWGSDGASTILFDRATFGAGTPFPASGGAWLSPGSAPDRVRGVVGDHLVEWRITAASERFGGVRKLLPAPGGAVVVTGLARTALVDPGTGRVLEEGPALSTIGPPDAVPLGPGDWVYAGADRVLKRWSPAGEVALGPTDAMRIGAYGPGGYVIARRSDLERHPAGGPVTTDALAPTPNVALFGDAGAARVAVAREDRWLRATGDGPLEALPEGVPAGRPECGLWVVRDAVARRLDRPGEDPFPSGTLELCDLGGGLLARLDGGSVLEVRRGASLVATLRIDRPADLIRAGDWLVVGSWDGRLLRVPISALSEDAAALRERVRAITGWRVAGGGLVPDPRAP